MPKNMKIYPTMFPLKNITIDILYKISLPDKISDLLFQIEKYHNRNYHIGYKLPFTSLQKMLMHYLCVLNFKDVTENTDNSNWILSKDKIDEELFKEVFIAWIKAFYIDETILKDKRQHKNCDEILSLVDEIESQIRTTDFSSKVYGENIKLIDENGEVGDNIAFNVIPYLILRELTGKKITFNSNECRLIYSDNNELITSPTDLVNRSFVINFSLQTLPLSKQVYLNIKLSLRRWLTEQSNSSDKNIYLKNNLTFNLIFKSNPNRVFKIETYYNKQNKANEFSPFTLKIITKLFNLTQSELPTVNEILQKPIDYANKQNLTFSSFIPYSTALDNDYKMWIKQGVSFDNRETVFNFVKNNIDFLNNCDIVSCEKSSLRIAHFKDSEEIDDYYSLLDKAVNKNKLKFLILSSYSNGQYATYIANYLQTILGKNADISIKECSDMLELMNGKKNYENYQTMQNLFESSDIETVDFTECATIAYVILPDKTNYSIQKYKYNEQLSSNEKIPYYTNSDPKNYIRSVFAKNGILTQFISEKIVKKEFEGETKNKSLKINNAIFDGFRQLGIVMPMKNEKNTPRNCVGAYVVPSKRNMFDCSTYPFNITIKCDFNKQVITGWSDILNEYNDLLYYQLLLKLSARFSAQINPAHPIKSDCEKVARHYNNILKKENCLIIVENNGTVRQIFSGISNKTILENNPMQSKKIELKFYNYIDINEQCTADICRIRCNSEVPDYYTSLTNSNNYGEWSGIFPYKTISYILSTHTHQDGFSYSKKSDKSQYDKCYTHRNLIEVYPLYTQNATVTHILELAREVQTLRNGYISSQVDTIYPLPLKLAYDVNEYLL